MRPQQEGGRQPARERVSEETVDTLPLDFQLPEL